MPKITLHFISHLSVVSTDSPWITAVRLVAVVLVFIIPIPHQPSVVHVWRTCDGKILSNVGESALLVGPKSIVVEDTLLCIVLSHSCKLRIPHLDKVKPTIKAVTRISFIHWNVYRDQSHCITMFIHRDK
jgi:hypothetical protein